MIQNRHRKERSDEAVQDLGNSSGLLYEASYWAAASDRTHLARNNDGGLI